VWTDVYGLVLPTALATPGAGRRLDLELQLALARVLDDKSALASHAVYFGARRVVAEYLSAAPISAVREAVETLSGPALLRCVHTHSGAAIACTVLAYATPKERKMIVKGMKGVAPCPGTVGLLTCTLSLQTGMLRALGWQDTQPI
jgi:hypothetical protein